MLGLGPPGQGGGLVEVVMAGTTRSEPSETLYISLVVLFLHCVVLCRLYHTFKDSLYEPCCVVLCCVVLCRQYWTYSDSLYKPCCVVLCCVVLCCVVLYCVGSTGHIVTLYISLVVLFCVVLCCVVLCRQYWPYSASLYKPCCVVVFC